MSPPGDGLLVHLRSPLVPSIMYPYTRIVHFAPNDATRVRPEPRELALASIVWASSRLLAPPPASGVPFCLPSTVSPKVSE